MANNPHYFKHDCNASRSLELMEIRAIYGYEGLGLFWTLIEILREQKDYSWDEKKIKILAKIMDADEIRFSNFVHDCKRIGLLKVSESGGIFSQRLFYDMDIYESKKQAGKSGGIAKGKQKPSKVLPKLKQTPAEQPTSIVYDSIEEKEKTIAALFVFDEFRRGYPGDVRGNETEFDWFRKKTKNWEEVLPILKNTLARHIRHRELMAARGEFVPSWKHLQTWISKKCWEQVIVLPEQKPPVKEVKASEFFGYSND